VPPRRRFDTYSALNILGCDGKVNPAGGARRLLLKEIEFLPDEWQLGFLPDGRLCGLVAPNASPLTMRVPSATSAWCWSCAAQAMVSTS